MRVCAFMYAIVCVCVCISHEHGDAQHDRHILLLPLPHSHLLPLSFPLYDRGLPWHACLQRPRRV
ncbi:MAG: hypothetical protein P4L40_14385 [Terracidiphilus sp.]|nr:hypothetical protein [Terracidiphilus sp.]